MERRARARNERIDGAEVRSRDMERRYCSGASDSVSVAHEYGSHRGPVRPAFDPTRGDGYIADHDESPYPIRSQSIRRPETCVRGYRGIDPRRRDGPALSTGHLPGRFRHTGARDGHGRSRDRPQLPCGASTACRAPDAARLFSLLEKINEALDQSPAPTHEWRALQGVLGVDLLTRLLGISPSSARRYISASRSTPDAIAARLHFLAFVVGDLAGAYNHIGVPALVRSPARAP